uniref:Uncharacterized protein n=1 Tax=Pyrodinium bahamense TaxID=73915 RepID=A0A7S0FWU0_9DINO|mmetsp:Transcript_5362/g.14937  ORF Transcript_5362/g.14937 Transcript_5362/m.14937 type:complete len:449 (+) Transcript_5362:210-1556(+)
MAASKPEAWRASTGDVADLEKVPLLAREAQEHALEPGDEFLTPGEGHHPFLDITRICCVWCVAIDHGNARFGRWNTLFTQDWVLQYLYLVCGVCYGMSRRSLLSYEVRLGAYVVIGIFVNWTAWVVTQRDWKGNFFNVIFHLWFVLGLMVYAACLAPLRPYLERLRRQACAADESTPEADHPESPGGGELAAQRRHFAWALAVLVGGPLAIALLFVVCLIPFLQLLAPFVWRFCIALGDGGTFWGLPSTVEQSREFIAQLCTYCMLTCCNLYLICVCPWVFRRTSITTWAVFCNTYGHRLLFYRAQDERPFHGVDLMLLALTSYYLGLRHRRVIGELVVRYWFVVLFFCGLLWPPGIHGRFDEDPPKDIELRVRVNLLEAIFVVVWLVAGERIVSPEIFKKDKMDFMNDWALVVFLTHKAVHIVVPSPLNWAFLVGLAFVCWLCRNCR